jgi:hypothetical protein
MEPWESPHYTVARECRYQSELLIGGWQLLARLPRSRCASESPLTRFPAGSGTVTVPTSTDGSWVVAHIECPVTTRHWLGAFGFKTPVTSVVIDGVKTRVVRANLSGPLMVRTPLVTVETLRPPKSCAVRFAEIPILE